MEVQRDKSQRSEALHHDVVFIAIQYCINRYLRHGFLGPDNFLPASFDVLWRDNFTEIQHDQSLDQTSITFPRSEEFPSLVSPFLCRLNPRHLAPGIPGGLGVDSDDRSAVHDDDVYSISACREWILLKCSECLGRL